MNNISRWLRDREGLKWSRNMVVVGEPAAGAIYKIVKLLLIMIYVNKTASILYKNRFDIGIIHLSLIILYFE